MGSAEDHLVGHPRGMLVLETPGEGPFRLARRQGRQGPRHTGTAFDASGGDRLAGAAQDMAASDDGIDQ